MSKQARLHEAFEACAHILGEVAGDDHVMRAVKSIDPELAKRVRDHVQEWRDAGEEFIRSVREGEGGDDEPVADADRTRDPLDEGDRAEGPIELQDMDKWAERYDDMNGAPEGNDDR